MINAFNTCLHALNWNKRIELPRHHQWKHANKPALLEWSVEARPYNTKVANIMFFSLLTTITLVFIGIAYNIAAQSLFEKFMGAPFYLLTMGGIYTMTHQKTKFSYRLTEECIETCEWKSPSKRWMIVLKWLTVITAIAALFVVALAPSAFWAALAGPGGMGLLYLGLANSKQFQEMHSLYRHNVFTWNEIKHIYIDRSRHLVSLEYEWLNENISKTLPWWTYIFCHKKEFETVVETIISKNITTPHTSEKVEVLQF